MQEEKTEGIVLRSLDYKERHRIITLFTPLGCISLIVRSISKKNTRLLSLTTPFCHAEYLYLRGNSELLTFRDGSVLDPHLTLRQSLKSLQIAGELARTILTSQLADKPAPALFALYKSYHHQVPQFNNSEVLVASFQLKLLKHEGLLNLTADALEGFQFSTFEWDQLFILSNALQFTHLRDLELSSSFTHKIDGLFHSRIS
jgi:DNA repair protein RecO (recombination protein O)